ncbi:mucoidy inhibitor MuiA family protein [Thalassobellus suaedae]|uniref:Mucoidy inhibitor MuiA family protein n=1 Tax=Thalassobellus suaedae TaxID=3074124 RepID=A0ABY9XW08_9FLAO|nr:mucoidy inhibitor MuiA family protein [Flavobacteriaceae bacterium HL-DH14]
MKNLLFLFLFVTTFSFSTNQKPTATSINEVTVYVNGAQITRTAKISLPIGTTTFKFDKLSPNIQESSIQISGLKSASVLSINYGINYFSKQNKSEDIEALQSQITLLNDNIQFENDLISGYEEELKVIHDNRHIGNENQAVTLEKLQQFADYYRKRITKIKNLIHASSKKKLEFNEQITEIQKQLIEFNVDDKVQTGEITVKLNSNQVSQLNLIIKYNVDNAGWFPIYDIKADKINAPLQLAYKAHVYQSTGSDWNNVKLILSTNDPNTNNEKPEVNPKYLNFISRYSTYNSTRATKNYNYKYNPFIQTVSGIVTDESGSPIPGVNILIKGTSNGVTTDFDGKYSIRTNGGKELVYSYLGYKTESLPIHSSITNLSLQEDVSMLEEVVVVGYGTQDKRNTTGSVSSINMESKSNNYQKKEENQTTNGDIIEEGITNQRFEIKKPYTIQTNGDITVIEIDKYLISASFSYFTAPIINENVFLTAKMGDWEQYNLLPGEYQHLL